MGDINGFVTVAQAAELYGFEPSELYDLIKRGKIRYQNAQTEKRPFYFIWEDDLKTLRQQTREPRQDASGDQPETLAHAMAEYTQVEQRIFQISAQLAPDRQDWRKRVEGDRYDEWRRRAEDALAHAWRRKSVLEQWMADYQRDYPACIWELYAAVTQAQMQIIALQAQLLDTNV